MHRFLFAITAFALVPDLAIGATLFESGTLGPTGVNWGELPGGSVPSTSVDSFVFVGVRFSLDQPVITHQVGGHFVSRESGTFFGAIVELDGESDTPDSFDFSTSDFRGATLLDFPVTSDEVFGNLSLELDPGWYALIFGSGLFGASGDGAAVRNGIDVGEPTYIAAEPYSGVGVWVDVGSELPNHRFVVQGQIVPEPLTISLALCAYLIYLLKSRTR